MFPKFVIKGIKSTSGKLQCCIRRISGVWIENAQCFGVCNEAWAIGHVVYCIKTDTILSCLLRAASLASYTKLLYPLKVFFCEGTVIVNTKCWSLEVFPLFRQNTSCTMLTRIMNKMNFCGPCIFCILNNLFKYSNITRISFQYSF